LSHVSIPYIMFLNTPLSIVLLVVALGIMVCTSKLSQFVDADFINISLCVNVETLLLLDSFHDIHN
jgi:hypothetical protein